MSFSNNIQFGNSTKYINQSKIAKEVQSFFEHTSCNDAIEVIEDVFEQSLLSKEVYIDYENLHHKYNTLKMLIRMLKNIDIAND